MRFCCFLFSLFFYIFSNQLLAQSSHNDGLFLRTIGGVGVGSITEHNLHVASGRIGYYSMVLGWFAWENLALYTGIDYIHAQNIKHTGKSNEPQTEGSYTYAASTTGISKFFTSLSLYVSLELRANVGGQWKAKSAIREISQTTGQIEETNRTQNKEKFQSGGLGIGLILALEEWFITDRMSLGIALIIIGDLPREHRLYGLGLGMFYN